MGVSKYKPVSQVADNHFLEQAREGEEDKMHSITNINEASDSKHLQWEYSSSSSVGRKTQGAYSTQHQDEIKYTT